MVFKPSPPTGLVAPSSSPAVVIPVVVILYSLSAAYPLLSTKYMLPISLSSFRSPSLGVAAVDKAPFLYLDDFHTATFDVIQTPGSMGCLYLDLCGVVSFVLCSFVWCRVLPSLCFVGMFR